ncbi:MAG: VTT domain-containing protein [Verrucomicrobiae bacterium]|nr:VTT domain-containing protein [Verrucomicrobiae bacterium]
MKVPFRKRFPIAVVFLLPAFLVACQTGTIVSDSLAEAETLPPAVIAFLLGAGTMLSEDLACVAGGTLAAHGILPYWLAAFGCLAGTWIGDIGLYGLGRLGRGGLLDRAPFRWFISGERVEQGRQLFERHGGKIVFSSRFLPGSRLPIYVAAGLVRYPFWQFAAFMALACLLWTPILVGVAYKIGDVLLDWLEVYEKAAWLVILALIAIIWLLTQGLEYGLTHRGRRMLFSKWSRLREWEFWPMWVFYPPVFAWILWLGIRHRSLTLFALANPGMPLGGLALESKSEILGAFAEDPDSRAQIARWTLLPPGSVDERLDILRKFLSENGLGYPLVLKPDIGERGQGVGVMESEAQAADYLAHCAHPVIGQEYVDGLEFGVFYFRFPEAKSGEILSITEKTLPLVTGDGGKRLEDLILDDPRAVKMAPHFLEKWAHHLNDVPAAGEKIRLTDLGTHCRGAIFLDGRVHTTDELRDSIDDLSRRFDGFFFGRYDIKVPSIEDLEAGRNLRILELNGVTSESTHIYSPGYSIFQAWADLIRQWNIAFEIGEANRSRGMRPPEIGEIWRTLREHRAHDWFEVPGKGAMATSTPSECRK